MDLTIEDIRGVLPTGTSDPDLQEKLDDALAWVYLYAPCAESPEFPAAKAALVRSLIRRALKYEVKTDDGSVTQKTTGAYGVMVDNRRPVSPGLFHPDQVTILQSLCASSTSKLQAGPFSIELQPRLRPF